MTANGYQVALWSEDVLHLDSMTAVCYDGNIVSSVE